MRKYAALVVASLVAGVAFAPASHADIIQNGTFSAGLAGWNPTTPTAVTATTFGGVTGALFASTAENVLFQSFQTVAGTNYNVSLFIGDAFDAFLAASVTSGSLTFTTDFSGSGNQYVGAGLSTSASSVSFTGDGGIATLALQNFDIGSGVPAEKTFVTNVAVTDIPEPMSLVLMGVGLAGLAAVRLRKSV